MVDLKSFSCPSQALSYHHEPHHAEHFVGDPDGRLLCCQGRRLRSLPSRRCSKSAGPGPVVAVWGSVLTACAFEVVRLAGLSLNRLMKYQIDQTRFEIDK